MKKVLIAIQGPLNSDSLRCAKTFLQLKHQVLMICWPINEHSRYDFGDLKVDFIDDPGTIIDELGLNNLCFITSQILVNKINVVKASVKMAKSNKITFANDV